MGKASTKHFNQRKIPLPSFPLGLDWSTNPEGIPDGALVKANNCEYNYATGALRTSPGITIKLDHGASIDSLFWDSAHGVFLFSSYTGSVNELYKTTDFSSKTKIGNLSGVQSAVYHMFNEKVLIASGGVLQIYDGTTLSNTTSPNCTFVMEREKRALICGDTVYKNRLRFSGTLDPTKWTDGTAADSVYIDIGDSSAIIAIDDVATDLVIYKENGTYRLRGIYGEWEVVPGPRSAKAMNRRSAVSVGTSSYFVGYNGFLKLQATDTYADVEPFEEGLAVNAFLVKNMDANAKIWHVPNRKQIWLTTKNDKTIYLYHYLPRLADGRGAFTIRELKWQINDLCAVGDKVYIAYGNKIGILDDDSDKDDGQQIVTEILSKRYLPVKLYTILKYSRLHVFNVINGTGIMKIGAESYDLLFNTSKQDIFGNTNDIYNNFATIWASDYSIFPNYGGGSNEELQVAIQINTGAIEIRSLDLEVAEV